jgi:bacillithiol biosynthesis cysteine-adding enzyme BshC
MRGSDTRRSTPNVTAQQRAPDPRLHLRCDRFLSGLAKDFVEGRHLDLLSPLGFVAPGRMPELEAHAGERARIAADLERANVSYGHPRARELAQRFADPGTLVIVAGQQAGLFGGPLYTLTKMAGAALWAERLEGAGRRAVAAFWVATEDHDYAEVARAGMLGPDGPRALELGPDPAPLEPVGMRTLGPDLAGALEAARALYPRSRGGDAWELLEATYRPDARFGEAFGKLMVGLLGGRAPLLLDSMLPSLKRAQRPWLRRAVERRHEVVAACGRQAERIASAGRALQVGDDAQAAPLFVVAAGQRRRVLWDGERRFTLRGVDAPARDVAELLELIEDNPAVVSPGVLLRPPVQDATLGTALMLMGPGELAYLAQAAPLYTVLEVAAPRVALRPQMLVLDRKQRAHLASLGLTLDDLLRAEREVHALLAAGGTAETIEALRASTLGELDRLKSSVLEVDAGLARPFEKTREQIERALELFGDKVSAAVVRRDDIVRARFDALRAACLPGGAPQERALATAHFALRHGLGFGAAVLAQLDVASDAVQIVDPDAMAPDASGAESSREADPEPSGDGAAGGRSVVGAGREPSSKESS